MDFNLDLTEYAAIAHCAIVAVVITLRLGRDSGLEKALNTPVADAAPP